MKNILGSLTCCALLTALPVSANCGATSNKESKQQSLPAVIPVEQIVSLEMDCWLFNYYNARGLIQEVDPQFVAACNYGIRQALIDAGYQDGDDGYWYLPSAVIEVHDH